MMKISINNLALIIAHKSRHLGYENAAKIAKTAYKENQSLRKTAIKLGLMTGEEFDQHVKPNEMVHPK